MPDHPNSREYEALPERSVLSKSQSEKLRYLKPPTCETLSVLFQFFPHRNTHYAIQIIHRIGRAPTRLMHKLSSHVIVQAMNMAIEMSLPR